MTKVRLSFPLPHNLSDFRDRLEGLVFRTDEPSTFASAGGAAIFTVETAQPGDLVQRLLDEGFDDAVVRFL